MTGPGGARSRPPLPGAPRPYAFPAVHAGELDNTMPVLVVYKPGAPVVSATVLIRGGETAPPPDRAGLAVLTGDALEGGTEHRSGHDLARSLEDIGATFGASTGWDSTTVSVSCMPEHLAGAMPLLAELVRAPAFDEHEFGRYRAQRLAAAAHRRMDPSALAADALMRFVFADGDTYARPLAGTEETLREMRPDDARRFAAAHYGPEQAAVVVVGDVEPAEARGLVEAAFGDWDAGQEPAPEAAVRGVREGAVHVVHRPGAVQSEIRVGQVGVSRLVNGYTPLVVANLVLGGSFMSRLNLSLRERHGFTYGARSSFAARRGRGPFVVSTAVESAVTAAAVREIHTEIESMAASGPTSDEVAHATSYLAGVFPLRLEAVASIASRIAGLIVYGLPLDYYRGYRERVRSVNRQRAARAIGRHLRPGELCTVVVGDADQVAPPLEELDIGSVHVHGAPTS